MIDYPNEAKAQRYRVGPKLRPGGLDCWLPDAAETVMDKSLCRWISCGAEIRRFHQTLRGVGPNSALTFVIFGIYKVFQKFV